MSMLSQMGSTAAGGIGGAFTGGFQPGATVNQTMTPGAQATSPLEQQFYGQIGSQATDYQNFVSPMDSNSVATNYQNSSNALSQALQAYASNSGMPTTAQMGTAQGVASQLFAPQQQSLNTSFYNQNIQAQRQAALQGRSMNDPILAAKLATAETQQQGQLSAQQGAQAQNIALSMPGQQLTALQQNNQLNQGLYNQAMTNRQYIMGMGQNIVNMERGYGLNTGTSTMSRPSQFSLPGMIGGLFQGMAAGGGGGNSGSGFSGLSGGGMSNMMGQGPQQGSLYSYSPVSANTQQFGPWSGGMGYGSMSGGFSGGGSGGGFAGSGGGSGGGDMGIGDISSLAALF